jgi:hypothetical protein
MGGFIAPAAPPKSGSNGGRPGDIIYPDSDFFGSGAYYDDGTPADTYVGHGGTHTEGLGANEPWDP